MEWKGEVEGKDASVESEGMSWSFAGGQGEGLLGWAYSYTCASQRDDEDFDMSCA